MPTQDLYRLGHLDGFNGKAPQQPEQPYYMYGHQRGQELKNMQAARTAK